MILTMKNKKTLNLKKIHHVEVRKTISLCRNGRLLELGWNVYGMKEFGGKILITSYPTEDMGRAMALKAMLNQMKRLTTTN